MGLNRLMMGGSSGLPSEETILHTVSLWSDSEYFSLTVPKGVKVLKVTANLSEDSGELWAATLLDSYDTSGSGDYKRWILVSVDYGGENQDTKYIGVTPLKTYNFTASISWEVGATATITISYSAAINQQTPTVKDY